MQRSLTVTPKNLRMLVGQEKMAERGGELRKHEGSDVPRVSTGESS